MAMVNNGIVVSASVQWNVQNTANSIVTTNQGGFSYSNTLSSGTGATEDTADLLFAATYTIATSGNQELDLAGSLTDFFGNTITMARVKVMYIHHDDTTTATHVDIGNGTSPLANWISTATVTVRVRNNGIFLLSSPDGTAYAVTAGSADDLKILNGDGSNSATVNVCVVGGSA